VHSYFDARFFGEGRHKHGVNLRVLGAIEGQCVGLGAGAPKAEAQCEPDRGKVMNITRHGRSVLAPNANKNYSQLERVYPD
jgi:hypothetical protein